MEDNKETLEAQEVDKDVETQVVDEKVVETEEDNVAPQDDSQVDDAVAADPKESDEDDDSQDEEDSEADKEAMAAIKKVRNEAKNLRKRLKDANETIAELQANSDAAVAQERDALKKELDDLKIQIRNDKISSLVSEEASKMGAIEPSIVAKLIDLNKVTFDEEGKATNVKELVTETRNQYKKLFSGVTGSGNIGSRDERGSDLEGTDSQSLLAKGFKRHDD